MRSVTYRKWSAPWGERPALQPATTTPERETTRPGSIFKRLNREELCIGEAFWDKVLPPELSYEKFIEIYQDEFNHGVEMSRRLRELDL